MKLTEFLLARIAEDEGLAYRSIQVGHEGAALVSIGTPSAPPVLLLHPTRVLAECEAKRRIVKECAVLEGQSLDGAWWLGAQDDILEAMAAVYADHADYRDEWRS